MYQEGEVNIVKCSECKEEFPSFVFIADTDMVTNGCVSLTGLDKNIALTMYEPDETEAEVEARIGINFKVLKVRFEAGPSSKGMSFQEFRKHYKPPKPIYTCIYCGGESYVLRIESKEQFLEHSKIEIHNDR